MDIAKGKYERTDAKNYDELLKALDVNFLLRKAATASTPVMEVSILKINILYFKFLYRISIDRLPTIMHS